MKIQATPDYLIFADESKTGELKDFPNVLRGWGVTVDQTQSKPPMEWMNGAFNRIDKNTLYLLQQGVPEWNANVLYPVNAITKYKGVLYTATVQNDNAVPSTNTTKWSTVVDGKYLPATKKGDSYTVSSDVEFKKTPTVNGDEVLTRVTSTGRLLNIIKFDKTGTYTPTEGTKFIIVEAVGGGGGGGGAATTTSNTSIGSGGGSGAYVKSLLQVDSLAKPVSVVIGAGGLGGKGTEGRDGGDTSFNGNLVAGGGSGGGSFPPKEYCFVGHGGVGGTPVGGNVINARGSFGTTGFSLYNMLAQGGDGGASFFGGGVTCLDNKNPHKTETYGSGGCGVSAGNNIIYYAEGSDGYQGVVIIQEFA